MNVDKLNERCYNILLMQPLETIQHHGDIRSREQETLTSSIGQLLPRARAAQLHSTAVALSLIARKEAHTTRILPRLSHYLLERAFKDSALLVKERSHNALPAALDFIEEVVLPMTDVTVTEPAEAKLTHAALVGCIHAEGYFKGCLDQINLGQFGFQDRIKTYHDAKGTPIALQKSKSESTALTLKPLTVDGATVIPAGTIAGVDTRMMRTKTGSMRGRLVTFDTYEVDGPFALCPKRLSPWAYNDPLDRSIYAVRPRLAGGNYHEERGDIVVDTTLEDFQHAAAQVMQMCGVC
jgi:hypothetical protein